MPAPKIKNGTTRSKVDSGAKARIKAPTMPPHKATKETLVVIRPLPCSSFEEDKREPIPVNIKAAVLVVLALTAGSPNASRVG